MGPPDRQCALDRWPHPADCDGTAGAHCLIGSDPLMRVLFGLEVTTIPALDGVLTAVYPATDRPSPLAPFSPSATPPDSPAHDSSFHPD